MSPAALHNDLGQIKRLPLRYDNSNSDKSALKLIQTLVPEWAGGDSRVEFSRFTDGITNTLLKAVNRRPGLSKQEIDADAILLRAYGNKTAILIDREREATNHELLSQYNLAPELLARFENGMLYRFVPGTPAVATDLSEPALSRAVARRLAEWHVTVPCLHRPSQNGGTSGSNGHGGTNGVNRLHRSRSIDEAAPTKPAPNVWTTLSKWILALPTDTEKERERVSLLQDEMDNLVEHLSNRPGLGHNGLVFSHCDLLCANIIIHRKEGQDVSVSFIDYEYGTPSPAAFDVANHFAEWAGYDCDYTALPTVSHRRTFIREYIKTYAKLSGKEMDEEQETRKLMDEVDLFRGVPGFFWGIWALIQTTISEIDFDYASYAELRLGEYFSFKAERDGSREAAGKEIPQRERIWAQSE